MQASPQPCLCGQVLFVGVILEHDPEKWVPVFLATNASVCAEIMLKQKTERDDDSKKSSLYQELDA